MLNRLVKVVDHDGNVVEYGWDNVGNKTVQGYPDGGITKFEYDANGNKIFKEYPNYETAYYFYDACDRVIEMDEFDLGGKKLFKTTYSWDAEGNLLTEMQYNHGQSGASAVTVDTAQLGETYAEIVEESRVEAETPTVELPVSFDGITVEETTEAPALIGAEVFQTKAEESTEATSPEAVDVEVPTAEAETPSAEVETPEVLTEVTETEEDPAGDSSNNSSSGNPEGFEWGNGNGEVPPGQNVDEDGNIVNNGGNTPPGLNRREKTDKEENPNKPEKPENPGTEDSDDKKANKAQQGILKN